MLGWQLGQVVLVAYLTVELRAVQVGTVIAWGRMVPLQVVSCPKLFATSLPSICL